MSAYNTSNGPSSGTQSTLLLPDNSAILLPPAGRWIGRHDFSGKVSESIIQQISREHLFIGIENSAFFIEDHNSTNGTRLNGAEISGTGRHPLRDGDTVELGGVVSLRFRTVVAPIPPAPVTAASQPAPVPTHGPFFTANSSGQGQAATVPSEINKWHWGAFFLNWIWGIGNNVLIALLCLVPGVNFVMIFVLGARGNEWAWRNKRWDSIEHFKRTQHKWSAWGVGLFLAGVVINVLYLVVMASCLR